MEDWEERVKIFSDLPVAAGPALSLCASCSLFSSTAQPRAYVEPVEVGVREDGEDKACEDPEAAACAGLLYTLQTRTARTSMLILYDAAALGLRVLDALEG